MSFSFVTSDFYVCTLHRIIEKCLPPSPVPVLTPSAGLILPVFTLCNVSLPMLVHLEILTCSLGRDHVGTIQESGRWGREEQGGHKSQHYLFLREPRWRRRSPWRERARTFCDPFCPHPHWAFSLLTSPGQYLGSQGLGECKAGSTWFATYFVGYLHLPAQWDWQKNNTFDMLFYLSAFCHDILWCKFLILLQLSAALAVTARGQQWG